MLPKKDGVIDREREEGGANMPQPDNYEREEKSHEILVVILAVLLIGAIIWFS